jgi:galactokinase
MKPTGHRSPSDVAVQAFRQIFSEKPEWVSRAPGRVNLIGGHVDYNDGLVLPAALELTMGVAFRPRSDARVRIHSVDFKEIVEFDLDELAPGSVDGWAAYPAGVAWAMVQAGYELTGIDAAVAGNIPLGGGLSSSAAVEIAFALAYRQSAEFDISEIELAKLGQVAENKYVGVRCGIMDQVASACAQAGHAIQLDCRNLEVGHVSLSPSLRIVVLDSEVKRELSGSDYNQRRRECEDAVARLKSLDYEIDALRDIWPDQLSGMLRHVPPPLDRRVRHVVGEIERVRLAVAALEQDETERFGELLFASHRSLRNDYEVSCDELDSLVELARQAPGCIGARLTGAGFGGCTVNVVSAALADDFVEYVETSYEKLYGVRPTAWTSDPAGGAAVDPIW